MDIIREGKAVIVIGDGLANLGSKWSIRRQIDGLVQERGNSIANALELRLSCTNPSMSNNRVVLY